MESLATIGNYLAIKFCDFRSNVRLFQFHKWIARALTIILMVSFYLFATRSDYVENRFALKTIIEGAPKLVLFSGGLWLSSVNLGFRLWWLTCFLLIPCVLTAYLSSFYFGEVFAFLAMLYVLLCVWIVFKNRSGGL